MPSDRTTSATIFVVDDEPIIAETLALILNIQGLDAKAFSKPHEALQAARLEHPDLLFSDVFMPEMTGVELAIQVQKDCPGCRVLLFSGLAATAELLAEAEANGHHFDLMAKPAHPDELLAKIRALLSQVA